MPGADLIITLDLVEQLGGETYLYGSAPIMPQLTVRQDGQASYGRNERLGLRLKRDALHLFDADGQRHRHPLILSEENIWMKALTDGRYRGRDGIWAVFDLGLRDGAARRHPGAGHRPRRPEHDGGYRLDRGWSIAPGGLEPALRGQIARRPPRALRARKRPLPNRTARSCSKAPGLTRRGHPVSLSESPGTGTGESRPFLQDRPTQAYFLSRKTGALQHVMARDEARAPLRHRRQGRPLDHTGRRFKIDAVDPCGFDAELSDPLYKMIPFVIVDGPAGAHGIFYDNLAVGEMDLGCTIDNYHGLFRSYSAQDGDLDFYVLAGPNMPDVVATLLVADRRAGFRTEVVARLRHDIDDDRRRAGCGCADHGLHREVPPPPNPLRQLSLRLGLHLDRPAPLRVQLEPRQVSRPGRQP